MDPVVEVIKEGEIVRMHESQAIEEDLFILRRIIEPEKKMIEDINVIEKKASADKAVRDFHPLQKWREKRRSHQDQQVLKALKDHFNWDITRARREKGMTRHLLAEAVEVTEPIIKLVETGDLPTDDFVLISKIENVLGIQLRKEPPKDEINLKELQEQAEIRAKEIREKSAEKEKDIIQKTEPFSGEEIEIIDD